MALRLGSFWRRLHFAPAALSAAFTSRAPTTLQNGRAPAEVRSAVLTGTLRLLSPFSSYNSATGNARAHTSVHTLPRAGAESRVPLPGKCVPPCGKLLLFAKQGAGVQRFLGIFSSDGGRKGGGQGPLHLQNRGDWKVVINTETCGPPS